MHDYVAFYLTSTCLSACLSIWQTLFVNLISWWLLLRSTEVQYECFYKSGTSRSTSSLHSCAVSKVSACRCFSLFYLIIHRDKSFYWFYYAWIKCHTAWRVYVENVMVLWLFGELWRCTWFSEQAHKLTETISWYVLFLIYLFAEFQMTILF